jgi:serine/threonine-protein kinase
MREPPDLAEWEKRLAAAAARFSNDAELSYYLGFARQQRNNFEGAADAYQRAAKADPHFALAWWSRGSVKYLLGDAPAALASYEDCLRMAPQATVCLEDRASVFRREGDCDKMEAETRAAIAKEPDSALGYYFLAEALQSRGRPEATVREALRQYVDKLPQSEKSERDLFYKASLANLSGDFVAAEHFAREKERLIDGKLDRAEHFNVAALLADIYVESGRMTEAAAVATDFLNRQDLWIGFTNPLFFQNVLYRAGKLDLATFEARRADWLKERDHEIKAKEEGKQGQARERAFPWIDGYADFVQTREEAVAAISLLPVYLPLPPPTRRNVGRETALGKVYALTGDADGAKFFLSRAVAHCGALDYPSPHTRAHYYLGMSLEAAGDKPGACAAYGVVLSRWGDAKPRSVTAGLAKERRKALACK